MRFALHGRNVEDFTEDDLEIVVATRKRRSASNWGRAASLLTYFLVEMRASNRRQEDRPVVDIAEPSEPGPSPRRGTARGDESKADDGFDFLWHGRRLDNRADKVIGSKRAK